MDVSYSEHVDEVRQSLTKLMAIADRLESRNTQTVQRLEMATAALDQAVAQLEAGGEQFAQSALQLIASSVQQVVSHGSGQALGNFQKQLQQSADIARSAGQLMEQQRTGLMAARRSLIWGSLGALLLGSLIAAGGAAWVAHVSMQEVAQARFGQQILQATQRGVITRCGDSLCAKVGKASRRYGEDGQYVLLQE